MKKIRLITAMDVSGSMGISKRMLAKQYHYELAKLLNPYEELSKYYVAFTTSCVYEGSHYANNPEYFFDIYRSGGTYLSTGLEPILHEIQSTPKDIHNVVVIYSDGDNWGEDNDNAVSLVKRIVKTNTTFIFVEIKMSTYTSSIVQKIIENCSNYGNPVIKTSYNELLEKEGKELFYQQLFANIEGGHYYEED